MLQEKRAIYGTGDAQGHGQGREREACAPLADSAGAGGALGNVAEACRRGGIDRTSFHDSKRRFQLEGLDGLKDLPPFAQSHPMTTPPEVVARIEVLALEGRRLSAITIQKILNDKGLGTATSAGWRSPPDVAEPRQALWCLPSPAVLC